MKTCKTCKHFSRQPIMGSKELYQVCGYEAFTEELRKDDAGMSASYQSHSAHFDPTGGSGSGCPACLRAIELRADARAILDSLSQPAAPSARVAVKK